MWMCLNKETAVLSQGEEANSVTKSLSQHLCLPAAKKNTNSCAVQGRILGTTPYLQSIPQVSDANTFSELPLQAAQGCKYLSR